MAGPDFVNLNEKLELEALGMDLDTAQDDEAAVRRLVTRGHGRPHTWFGNVMGWTLFSVQERDEEDNEGGDGEATDVEAEDTLSDTSAYPEFEGMNTALSGHERRLSPPRADDGSWQDAAWLLSVASKVAWS
ncbi:hypothetical protein M406DRAFT_356090 [Cryphonectria parasitica EP155]|uniref:Uncharacterized protein n=1 Tax=Cryphonectria parasitica (strain ATCC 38755 / EP155) TaxID=660469 RepID=A0A9P5CPW7_CRYP1|nr:uncharacterized protein M406DRAFT_356090 [Cryphonectria parasitica EP155]KAF3765857.1 hypothetical protein M406DRAFT_356090 [Cryphonectria parasitica EP155]